jgi:hypothetical protein
MRVITSFAFEFTISFVLHPLSSLQFALFSADTSGGAAGSATALALDALLEAARPVFTRDEIGNASPDYIFATRADGQFPDEKYDAQDLCNKPDVPAVFQPSDPNEPYSW